ncbi:hypothetical protein Ahy_B07g087628 [Arachis hypogaea]|uniref:Aminotransferase-like plant mobile domain-containing protein n=1 Tax=Arachis hypogaea TaxID=3818 RepID=A0A444YCK7_ARAHY|nr:hypothetical protein Ahy_B07g087628 [Arachis hypogaea]
MWLPSITLSKNKALNPKIVNFKISNNCHLNSPLLLIHSTRLPKLVISLSTTSPSSRSYPYSHSFHSNAYSDTLNLSLSPLFKSLEPHHSRNLLYIKSFFTKNTQPPISFLFFDNGWFLFSCTTQDKGKGHVIAPPSPPALCILNQVNDEIIDDPYLQVNDIRILIPFTIGADTHCFLGPIETLERANKKLSFFPNAEGEDLLINQAFNISHFINQKPFQNNPKINPRGFDFTTWYQRLEPSKGAAWGALGIQELLRLEFIAHNMGEDGTEIMDNEHVAFLFYWLNAILFCSRSVQMSKLFLPLATLLHEGKALNLAKLLLGHIFEELGQFVCDLRDNKIINAGGPLWLLQLWLNAIFKNFMTKPEGGSTDKQHIEGFRLSDYKPNFPNTQSDEDKFLAVFSLFHSCKDFDNDQLNFTPFLHRNCGPAWLDRLLFPNTNEENELANRTWANLLLVQVIPIGLPQYRKERFKITLYAPHLTARQLGFSQAIPTPQSRHSEPFCQITLTSQEDFNTCLLKNKKRRDRFNFLIYERSSFITKSCFEWWATYYSSSPKRTHKRKADTTRPPPHKSRRTPTRASRMLVLPSSSESADESKPNKDTIAISSHSEDAADSNPGSQLVQRSKLPKPINVAQSASSTGALDQPIFRQQNDPKHSTSHDSIQFTGSLQLIPATHPPSFHTTQVIEPTTNPLQHSPEGTHILESISPNNQAVFSAENLVIPDSDSASKVADTTNSDFSRSKANLQTPPGPRPKTASASTTPTSASLDNLQEIENEEATAKSNIENCLATAQPIQASREEFDVKISHAISVQAFHDQEEARLEAELTQIQEQLATIRQSRATIAKPLTIAQQDQQHLIQELISIDTKRG